MQRGGGGIFMQDPRGAPSQELLNATEELLAETKKLMEACRTAYSIKPQEEGKPEGKFGIDRLGSLVATLRDVAPSHIADQVAGIHDLLNAFVLWREGTSDPLYNRIQYSDVMSYAPADRMREKTAEAKKLTATLSFQAAQPAKF